MTNQTQNDNIKPYHNVQIPAEVLLHPDIDPYTMKVFAYMKFRYQFFTHKRLPFMESNSTISERIGVSRSKVIESINKLISLGFVFREERHGKGSSKESQTNIYTVKDILTPNGEAVWQEKKPKKPKQDTATKQHVPVVQTTYFEEDDDYMIPF